MWQKTGALLLLALMTGCAQEAPPALIQPQGEYRLLPWETTRRQVDALLQGDQNMLLSVQNKPNAVTPPVLFALAYQLYQQQHYHDAMFWFYTAQLRARSDANKSLDASVQQGVTKLSEQFGSEIAAYGLSHPAEMEAAMRQTLTWDKTAQRSYNPRWVALHGTEMETQKEYAFLPMDRWPQIDQITHREYARGFARLMVSLRQGSGFSLPN
ncbi:hypothetical protein [Tolumonas lignilytica]|uniref:hypothetical protein n=1 Tax=Tolumonas lignilytica TaxID=1283284 RepID=UPI000466F6AC|nr:hypothetical protein [Tolumonas lignilytica]